MRELFVVNHESTTTSLVLRTEDGEEFFLDLSALTPGVLSSLGLDTPAGAGEKDGTPHEPQANTASAVPDTSPAHLSALNPRDLGTSTSHTTPGRPISDRLTMRPPEIQNRIRAGASIVELAQEMNVPESRVEPFAHPVLMERARIAELAKQAHPVREDGPAKLTVFEILATAFAARGHCLANATWDAYRVKGEPWTVRVSWKAGLSENEAEWTLKQSLGTPDTLVARNTVAADLTDPDFVQPVRSLTSLGRGGRRVETVEAIDARSQSDNDRVPYDEYEETVLGLSPDHELSLQNDEPKGALSDLSSARQRKHRRSTAKVLNDNAAQTFNTTKPPAGDDKPASATSAVQAMQDTQATDSAAAHVDEDFLQNPDPQPKPSKRRRKAVTPHWEDVLLGVRANTKRPRE